MKDNKKEKVALSCYTKYMILDEELKMLNKEEIFYPESAGSLYGIDMSKLRLKRDFKVVLGVKIDEDQNIRPNLGVIFTPTGIKKLIQTNQKARDYIDELYKKYMYELDLPRCSDEVAK